MIYIVQHSVDVLYLSCVVCNANSYVTNKKRESKAFIYANKYTLF